jgi:tetratricopeptide (TPR) repeat protein
VIAMSPALWWNDGTGIVAYSDAIAKATKPQRLFVTSGGLEGEIDRSTRQFSERLDSLKPAATAFGHSRYENDNHGLTPSPSLADGLRYIFEPVSVAKLPISRLSRDSDSAGVVNALMESRRLYANGARFFGLDERLPEPQVNALGYNVLGNLKKPALAVWVFRQNVELYPESANVYDSLGDALVAAGDTTNAIAQYQRAVDIAARTKHPMLGVSLSKLSRLEAARTAQRKGS